MYINDYSDKYCITTDNTKSYINIYYKKMKIEWVLEEFDNRAAYNFTQEILKLTNNTEYNGQYRSFICKSKCDLQIIYDNLYKNHYDKLAKIQNIDLIEHSLLCLNSDDY